MATDSDTQLAVIVQKLDSLSETMRSALDDLRRLNADHETRLRDLETATTQLRERMTLWQLGQAAFATIAATVAAIVGRRP